MPCNNQSNKHPEQWKLLNDAGEKGQVSYKCRPIRITPYFSTETIKVKRAWNDSTGNR